jgi:ribosomal protein L35AE/L33A
VLDLHVETVVKGRVLRSGGNEGVVVNLSDVL